MANPKKRRKVDTWKTKRWYKIVAPKMFGEKEIGLTPASKPEAVVGRTVALNLYNLIGKRDLQYVKIGFKVVGMNGETAITAPIGHEYQRSYVSRITRRIHTLVRTIPTIVTSDGYKIQLTAIAVSRGNAHSSQEFEIRKLMNEAIGEAASQPFEKFFKSMVFGELAGGIYKKARKIFPINSVHIIKSEVLEMPKKEI